MRSNFTLIEVVLAVAVFSLLMLTLAMGVAAVQNNWSRIQKLKTDLEQFQLVERVVDPSFRNSIPFTWEDDNRKESQIFKGDPESIILAYFHRINRVSNGGIRFISMFIDGSNLIVEYSKYPIIYWKQKKINISREVLATNVKKISFLYADKEGDEITWLNDWDEDENNNIPLAIQIKVEWENGETKSWLRRTAGSGINESYGVRDVKR